jgi:anti-sigma factor RsiW
MRWWPLRRRSRDAEFVCREMVELMTAYLDDALEPGPRAAFERHLAGCPHCTEYLAQIRLVQEVAGRVEPEDVAPEARQDLMALFERWRADPESAKSAESESAEGSPEASG